jgi:hypothetical protein
MALEEHYFFSEKGNDYFSQKKLKERMRDKNHNDSL